MVTAALNDTDGRRAGRRELTVAPEACESRKPRLDARPLAARRGVPAQARDLLSRMERRPVYLPV